MQREDWDKRYASVENLWAVKPNRFLVAEVTGLEPGRALDLACGEGQNAIWSGVQSRSGSLGPPTPSVMLVKSWPTSTNVPPGASAAAAFASTCLRPSAGMWR